MPTRTLEDRLEALEDIEAIRMLKSRYLAACDAKDPAAMRACFADGAVAIDFGAVGSFDNADALVALYTQVACHPHMVEMHHGVNPQITRLDATRAKGHWGLHYQLINTTDRTLTQLGAHYDDEYRKAGGEWKIVATRCVVTSTLVLQLGDDAIKALVTGRMPAG